MTKHQENEQVTLESTLLNLHEQAICKKIAAGEAPHSLRALALLSLNEKSTQAQAAEQAGLSTDQVKYWVAKFRIKRLGIFPDTLLDELETKAKVKLVAEIEEKPEIVKEKKDSAWDKTKKSKAIKEKKGKKKTKKKKSDKTEKNKKAKKTKKKNKQAKKDLKNKKAKKAKKK